MKRVLVIGGAGFIGSHLVDRLVAAGNPVRVLDRVPIDLRPRRHGAASVENVAGDFMDLSAIDAAVREIDVAYHLVSTTIPATSNVDPVFDVQSNLIGTLSFFKSAQAAGVRKIVFVSSGGTIYGNARAQPIRETDPTDPICSYGIAKLAIEKYLALFEFLHGLRFVALRVSNAFGERQRPGSQGVIAAFIQKALKGMPLEIWGDGSVVRDYVHVHDVVDALVRGAAYEGPRRVFNVGSGVGRSVNEVVEALRIVAGRPIECIHRASRPVDVPKSVLDVSLIKQELGWSPRIDFSTGLARTWDWFQKHQSP
jgi:UDP-glucose 4-epimerase